MVVLGQGTVPRKSADDQLLLYIHLSARQARLNRIHERWSQVVQQGCAAGHVPSLRPEAKQMARCLCKKDGSQCALGIAALSLHSTAGKWNPLNQTRCEWLSGENKTNRTSVPLEGPNGSAVVASHCRKVESSEQDGEFVRQLGWWESIYLHKTSRPSS
jgi:hypothetical protein